MQLEKHTVDQDDFHQFRVLGVGGFGAVHAAVKRDTGCLVAIKRMDKKLIKHKNRYKSCFTEAECLQQMSSAFVCGLHYTFQTKDDVCLVLDLLHGGTLSYLLTQKKKVSERCVCFFTACIIFAYEALHTKGFVYRDMKPANVLIKDNGYAVLIDFGLAAKVETALKGKCGTRGYWSPEMVKVRRRHRLGTEPPSTPQHPCSAPDSSRGPEASVAVAELLPPPHAAAIEPPHRSRHLYRIGTWLQPPCSNAARHVPVPAGPQSRRRCSRRTGRSISSIVSSSAVAAACVAAPLEIGALLSGRPRFPFSPALRATPRPPSPAQGDQYLYSGDWWSLGVTLVELLTGKKPFKKKFQKRKNTEDYVLICKEGKVDDKIEELDIEAKLGKAKEEEDDGRDSNDEETDEEDDDDAKKGRRTSVRVIGGFDKTVESMVETEAAFELMEAAITANAKLAAFKSDELEGGMERLIKIMSVVKYEGDTEIFKAGEFATFFCIVLEGTLKGEVVHNVGDVVGWEGLFKDNYHRPSAVKAGLMGGTLGICLYSELGRAKLFDEPVIEALKGVLCDANGGGVDAATLESTLAEFGEAEDTHAEERFIATQKHSKSGVDAAALAEKQKELSASKQRDQKIYLTQEVWAKKSLLDRTTQKFLGGLLTRDVNQRLGCGPGNFSKIKEHDFFTQNGPLGQINWDKLEDQSRTAPYIPKQEVNAKDESKMKTFNTAGMKKLAKEDEAKWGTWDWTSSDYFQNEMSAYLYEQWGLSDAKKGRLGGGSSGGCCAVS